MHLVLLWKKKTSAPSTNNAEWQFLSAVSAIRIAGAIAKSQKASINLQTPNVNYSGRTAPLTSKVAFCIFIQQIKVQNILNTVYTVRLFLFKMQFVS